MRRRDTPSLRITPPSVTPLVNPPVTLVGPLSPGSDHTSWSSTDTSTSLRQSRPLQNFFLVIKTTIYTVRHTLVLPRWCRGPKTGLNEIGSTPSTTHPSTYIFGPQVPPQPDCTFNPSVDVSLPYISRFPHSFLFFSWFLSRTPVEFPMTSSTVLP